MFAFWLAAGTLWQREWVRFYRQPSRVVGAIGSPLVFWLVLGSGIGTSLQSGASGKTVDYLHYFFPGTLMMILLFTSLFSTISLIEDRKSGFMQAVLAAPVPRMSLVLGKIFGGATLAVMQGLIFMLLAPFAGFSLSPLMIAAATGVLFINAFALTGLGFLLAWQFRSVQGFHAVMNLFLIPLWLLSGALFPQTSAHGWIRFLMQINPLTYGLAALQKVLSPSFSGLQPIPFPAALAAIAFFSGAMLLAGAKTASRRSAKDLS